MKILITGGTGMLGKSLTTTLSIKHNVVSLGSKDCDLLDKRAVDRLINNTSSDYVIHCAALVGGIQDNIKRCCDYLYENSVMNLNVVDSCRKAGVPRLLSILSTCVYPDSLEELTEDMLHTGEPHETNYGYAYSKRLMAKHMELCNKQYGTQYSWICPSNLYGENDHRDERAHFVSKLIERVIKAKRENAEELVFYGLGTPVRQYLYVEDLARIIESHVDRDIVDNYNVAYDVPLSIEEMVRLVAIGAGFEGKIRFTNEIPGQQYRVASLRHFRSLHPNFMFTPFQEGAMKVYKAWQ
jgi:GDP-L-fucose synthase